MTVINTVAIVTVGALLWSVHHRRRGRGEEGSQKRTDKYQPRPSQPPFSIPYPLAQVIQGQPSDDSEYENPDDYLVQVSDSSRGIKEEQKWVDDVLMPHNTKRRTSENSAYIPYSEVQRGSQVS